MKKIEILIKNILLKIFLLLSGNSWNNSISSVNKNSKILFVRLNNIGDALVTTPLLNEIKKNIGCKTTVLASKRNYFIFNNNPSIDDTWLFEKGLGSFIRLIKKINNEDFDAIVDLHDDVSTTVSFIIALSKAKAKFGLEKENKTIFTKTTPRLNPTNFHVIERCAELGKLFNLNIDNKSLNVRYFPTESSIKKAGAFITEKFTKNRFLLGVNISAGGDARFWGVDNYKKLYAFLKQYDINILLLTAEKDLRKAYEIASFDDPVFFSSSFDEFAAVISKLNFLFSPDTSTIHLGSAYEVPVFGVYVKYNTKDVIWYPYKSEFDSVVTLEETLKNVTFEEVRDKLKPFLEKKLSDYSSAS